MNRKAVRGGDDDGDGTTDCCDGSCCVYAYLDADRRGALILARRCRRIRRVRHGRRIVRPPWWARRVFGCHLWFRVPKLKVLANGTPVRDAAQPIPRRRSGVPAAVEAGDRRPPVFGARHCSSYGGAWVPGDRTPGGQIPAFFDPMGDSRCYVQPSISGASCGRGYWFRYRPRYDGYQRPLPKPEGRLRECRGLLLVAICIRPRAAPRA